MLLMPSLEPTVPSMFLTHDMQVMPSTPTNVVTDPEEEAPSSGSIRNPKLSRVDLETKSSQS